MSRRDELQNGRRTLSSFAASFGSALAIVLMPKCPLCIAAALSSLGASAALSGMVAPVVRPVIMVMGAVAALAFAVGILPALWRRRSRLDIKGEQRRRKPPERFARDGLSCCGSR